jgi:hypothetical protein
MIKNLSWCGAVQMEERHEAELAAARQAATIEMQAAVAAAVGTCEHRHVAATEALRLATADDAARREATLRQVLSACHCSRLRTPHTSASGDGKKSGS